MSIDLVSLGMIMLLSTPFSVELSVCIGVFGWACPISTSVILIGISVFSLMNSAPNLALAADDITALITCEMFNTAPLFRGISSLPTLKNVLQLYLLLWIMRDTMRRYELLGSCWMLDI